MSNPIDLIFTRDFSLFMSDLWQELLCGAVRKEFGEGLAHQIVRFTGRAAKFYRIREELNRMKQAVVAKRRDDPLFSEERTKRFRKDVDALRSFFHPALEATGSPVALSGLSAGFRPTVKPRRFVSKQDATGLPAGLHKPSSDLQASVTTTLDLFTSMYPVYMASIFLPNPWREDFLREHGADGEAIVKRLYENRVYSEGLFKETDMFLRALLERVLEKRGEEKRFARVLRLNELLPCVTDGALPNNEEFGERLRGYILFGEKLLLRTTFDDFLREYDFVCDDAAPLPVLTEFHGNVACAGGVILGTVQVILNTDEVERFQKGNVLVTGMTSPEYIEAMKGAAAIITDEGGVTCHAAIVSRELNIPCVIGTKVATKMLRDGDTIEVDTTRGIVKKIG